MLAAFFFTCFFSGVVFFEFRVPADFGLETAVFERTFFFAGAAESA